MSQKPVPPDQDGILEDAWDSVVGGMNWLSSVLLGEFADKRPLSAVVADMLVSFIPGVVIVTSARDAVAVIVRLACHPEKRDDLMEWVLLSACLIVIALPIAMAAAGAAGLGVGAIVGGIAGSELGAALRAVMLLLIKEASKLVELVRFLQQFIKGDVLKFLRALKFVQYEKALLAAMKQITGKLVEIVRALRKRLESLQYFDTVKTTVARLVEWEKRFYQVQQDALKQMPRALAELDARLAKVLVQTALNEAHTAVAGVQANKPMAASPVKQRVRDTPGKVLDTKIETKLEPKAKDKAKAKPVVPVKETPDSVKTVAEGRNAKKQTVADAAAVTDRERITQLSKESREAEKNGDKILAKAKLDEARDLLKPHLPKGPNDNWDEVIKRLDVSSPKDGAVFWSGDPKAAQKFSEEIDGVTLETTAGGRIINEWLELKRYNWTEDVGPGPYARELWSGASEKYAESVTGRVNAVQTSKKLWDTDTLWHNSEKPIIQDKLRTGEISDIKMYTINGSTGEVISLSQNYVDSLMRLKGTAPSRI
ncbi:hypothetical protein [Massilia varians]|uniref:hypothetical protein n=1 Tax=Massilia varians TaxID=457921 RepID=UPI00255482F1|nr:hypothetical protein [Massilia varians]MDK6079995.1 hypothetical protein [Massilia varians]